jgi:hypothetical protein
MLPLNIQTVTLGYNVKNKKIKMQKHIFLTKHKRAQDVLPLQDFELVDEILLLD